MRIPGRNINKHGKEGGSLRQKGSLTAECAFVLPLFFLAIVIFVSLLDLYRLHILIQTTLCEGAKELGMYAYCTENDSGSPVGTVTDAVCIAYGTGKVRESLEGENLLGIQGGINGVFLLGSGFSNGTVTLKASFLYSGPGGLFSFFPIKIQILGQAQAWAGYNGSLFPSSSAEELVYITEWQSVCHTSRECTHISLSIRSMPAENIEEQVNQYGGHYYPCERCIDDNFKGSSVYVARTGSRYHSSRDCGGLTRNVTAVKRSEVQNLNICSRCGAKK